MPKCSPQAFAKCPTRHLCGTPEDATFADGSECDKFNQQVMFRPMTNADRIRAMSDEELIELLKDFSAFACIFPDKDCEENSCVECVTKWIKEEVQI